jgi:Flp pilus assembly protein TadG
MMRGTGKSTRCSRRGASAVELAILLPFLVLIFLVALDFGRIYYYTLTIENSARNGALWACDPFAPQYSYSSVQDAVQADAANLSPAIDNNNITSSAGVDASGNATVTVTVSYNFNLITNYLPIPNPYTVTRSVTMRKEGILPTNFPK